MTVSRRTFVSGGLTVLAGSAITSRARATGQIEIDAATPEAAAPVPTVAFGPTIASTAAELGYDQARMLAFVTDEIAYEPYAGALRGAEGTLWSRAGNSLDKAILLAALLKEALLETRFAFGPLDDDAATRLAGLSRRTADEVITQTFAAMQASVTPRAEDVTAATPPPPPSAIPEGDLETIRADGAGLFADATAAMERQLATIQNALDAAGVRIAAGNEMPLPAREIAQHAWLQMADGPVWVDLDPTFGEPVATLERTAPALAEGETAPLLDGDELRHMVTVRVIVEEVIGGALQEREAAVLDGPSTAFVGRQFAVVTLPPAGMDSLGLTISEGFTGQVSLVPMIVGRDTSVVADTPVVFGASGGFGDALSGSDGEAGAQDGETTALVVEVTVASPDREARTYRRALLDRLAAQRREAATPDLAALPAAEIVPFFDEVETVRGLDRAHILTVESAAVPFMTYLTDLEGVAALGPFGTVMPSVRFARDGCGRSIEVDTGLLSVIDGPNVSLATIARVDPAEDRGVRLALDLVHRQARPLHLADGPDGDPATAAMRIGILDQVTEAMTISLLATTNPDGIAAPVSADTVFAAALAADVGIVAAATPDALAALDTGGFDPALLEAALAEGAVLILPERPVAIDDADRTAAWVVDLATGATRDMLDDGSGGFSIILQPGGIHAQAAEEGILNDIAAFAARAFNRLTDRKIRCLAFVGMALLGAAAAGKSAGSKGGAVNDIGGGVGSVLGGGAVGGAVQYC